MRGVQTEMADIEAELKRKDSGGALVNWTLVTDAENTDTSLSDPVKDYGLQARVGEVTASPTANTVLDRLKGIKTALDAINTNTDGLEGFTDGIEGLLTTLGTYVDGLEAAFTTLNDKDFATQTTLAAAASTLSTIQTNTDGIEGLLTSIGTNTDGIEGFVDGLETLLTTLNTYVDGLESALTTLNATDFATEATLASQSSRFARLLKFEPTIGEELRADDVDAGDRYHGAAVDGTDTSSATWDVVRFYRDASANILRVRFRTAVTWDDKDVGWT